MELTILQDTIKEINYCLFEYNNISISSKGCDLINVLVKNILKDGYFRYLKNYLKDNPNKINVKNEKGWTPLMIVCANSNNPPSFDCISFLLENGTNINTKNKNGETALLIACKHPVDGLYKFV